MLPIHIQTQIYQIEQMEEGREEGRGKREREEGRRKRSHECLGSAALAAY
jgi:hypothetical protein